MIPIKMWLEILAVFKSGRRSCWISNASYSRSINWPVPENSVSHMWEFLDYLGLRLCPAHPKSQSLGNWDHLLIWSVEDLHHILRSCQNTWESCARYSHLLRVPVAPVNGTDQLFLIITDHFPFWIVMTLNTKPLTKTTRQFRHQKSIFLALNGQLVK